MVSESNAKARPKHWINHQNSYISHIFMPIHTFEPFWGFMWHIPLIENCPKLIQPQFDMGYMNCFDDCQIDRYIWSAGDGDSCWINNYNLLTSHRCPLIALPLWSRSHMATFSITQRCRRGCTKWGVCSPSVLKLISFASLPVASEMCAFSRIQRLTESFSGKVDRKKNPSNALCCVKTCHARCCLRKNRTIGHKHLYASSSDELFFCMPAFSLKNKPVDKNDNCTHVCVCCFSWIHVYFMKSQYFHFTISGFQ